MKHFIALFIFLLSLTFSRAQVIRLTTADPAYSTKVKGHHELGKPAKSFTEPEFGGAIVYFRVDVLNFKAVKAKSRLEMAVAQLKDGKESPNYHMDFFIPTKNGFLFMYAEFVPGEYVAYVRDKDNPDDVYSKAVFTVTGKPKTDYKHNSTMVICKSVDGDWNPVGQTTKIKQGECINVLYKAKDRMNFITLTWNIVRVKDDGTEEYLAHLNQGFQGKVYRWVATTESLCYFNTPGKYRIYLFDKDNYETGTHDDNSPYIGKSEFTVE